MRVAAVPVKIGTGILPHLAVPTATGQQQLLTAFAAAGPWIAHSLGTASTSVTIGTVAVGDVLVLALGCGGFGPGGVSALSSGVSGGGVSTWQRATGYLWTSAPTLTEIWWGEITTLSPTPVTVNNPSLASEYNRLWIAEFSATGSDLVWEIAAVTPASASSGSSALGPTTSIVTYPLLTGTGLYVGGNIGLFGTLSGTATGWTFTTIDSHFMVADNTSVTDGTVTGTDTQSDTMNPVSALFTVTGIIEPLSIPSTALPGGYATQLYPSMNTVGVEGLSTEATTLTAVGGVPPYTWTITSGSLPAGLSLSSAGLISGTASVAGTSSFTAQVTDSASSTVSAGFSITIAAAPAVVFNGAYPAGPTQWNNPGTDSQLALGAIMTPLSMNLNVWGPVTSPQETATSTVWSTRNWTVYFNADEPSGQIGQVTAYPNSALYPITFTWNTYSYILTGWDVTMPPWDASIIASAAYDNFIPAGDVIAGPAGAGGQVPHVNEIMHHYAHINRGGSDAPIAFYGAVQFGGYTVNGIPLPVTYWNVSIGSTAAFFDQCSPSGVSVNWTMSAGAIDYLAMLNWLVAEGYISSTSSLTGMGNGYEVCNTSGVTQPFQMNNWWCQAG